MVVLVCCAPSRMSVAAGLMLALTVPLFMMGGTVRPVLAGILILWAGWMLIQLPKNSRALASPEASR